MSPRAQTHDCAKAKSTTMRGLFLPATALVALALFVPIFAASDVSYERIRAAASEPQNWLTYSGNYQGHRYSALAQINRSNIARMKTAWVYQVKEQERLETSPIVLDGILYVTERNHVVTALDGKTGQPLWSFTGDKASARGCCGRVNRGVAILDDAVFTTNFDTQVVALNRDTGKERWRTTLGEPKRAYSSTGAPLAIRDKVIVGMGGGDYGARGFLSALDSKTGKELWRFWTVPGPGEAGHDTWSGDSWKTGGATTWVTGTYDPELNLLYWGTGNPGPDYNGDVRAGDNLYSSSLLALDADTGHLRWHFQFTPHDVHDRDSAQVPVLIDQVVKGRMRKLVVNANRNGFYYALDRETGEFLAGTPFVKQDWANGLDAKGRPLARLESFPTTEGTKVYPGPDGASNWMSPSFSPLTGMYYVTAFDNYPGMFYKRAMPYTPGRSFEGGIGTNMAGTEAEGVVKALDPATGQLRWQFTLHSLAYSGLLTTAGGLVFGGTREGDVFALDAEKGNPLWHFKAGGEIAANPVSYAIDGKQYVAVGSGSALFVFSVDTETSTRQLAGRR